jgi:cytochrome c oxidase subunit 3
MGLLSLRNNILVNNESQPFHLVDISPWPLYTSILAFQLVINFILFFNKFSTIIGLYYSILFLLIIICNWFYNIIIESTYQGHHTQKVQKGLKMGMFLFILSEIMLFFSFFWAFFHSSLAPTIWIGCVWPPLGIEFISPWHLPLLNTAILLSSGVSLTWSHRALVISEFNTELKNLPFFKNISNDVINGLFITILWGLLFTFLQYIEYQNTSFSFNDSVYGSVFFILTGFHGFHVILGTTLLIVAFIRIYYHHLFSTQHVGYECSIWYWHFVDVVWIFLYFLIYIWGC